MPSRFRVELLLPLLLLAAAPAAASWEVNGNATPGDFHAFDQRFSGDAYFFPLHDAHPIGLTGFEAYAEATYDSDFDNQSFNTTAVNGSYPGSFLSIARVGLRKGLPGGLDLGVAYGKALGSDIKFISAEAEYAILSGGLLSPALALRLTGTRTMDDKAYGLDQYGAELLLSKGFVVLTPYVGAGLATSRGTLDSPLGTTLRDNRTFPVLYAGLTLNLLIPKIHFEVEKGGTATQAAVRVGLGF
jgi:hypothetical protein